MARPSRATVAPLSGAPMIVSGPVPNEKEIFESVAPGAKVPEIVNVPNSCKYELNCPMPLLPLG